MKRLKFLQFLYKIYKEKCWKNFFQRFFQYHSNSIKTRLYAALRGASQRNFSLKHIFSLSLSLSWVYHDNNHCQNHCLQESDRLFIFGNFDCRGKKFTQNRATQMLEHRLKYQVVPIFDLVVSAANLTSRMNYSVLQMD